MTCLPELTQCLKDTAPTAANLEALAAAGDVTAAAAAGISSSSSSDVLSSIDGLQPEAVALLGWSLRSGSLDSMSSTDEDEGAVMLTPLDPNSPGAPAAGLDFFDVLVEQGAVKTATTSFPRMGECSSSGGLAVQLSRCSAALWAMQSIPEACMSSNSTCRMAQSGRGLASVY